jgi:hypothetical protein
VKGTALGAGVVRDGRRGGGGARGVGRRMAGRVGPGGMGGTVARRAAALRKYNGGLP